MLERLNVERRRTYVVRIFPNPDSWRCLVRALAVETHEKTGWRPTDSSTWMTSRSTRRSLSNKPPDHPVIDRPLQRLTHRTGAKPLAYGKGDHLERRWCQCS